MAHPTSKVLHSSTSHVSRGERGRREGPREREAEAGGVQPPAKDRQEPPNTNTGRSSPGAWGGSTGHTWTLDSGLWGDGGGQSCRPKQPGSLAPPAALGRSSPQTARPTPRSQPASWGPSRAPQLHTQLPSLHVSLPLGTSGSPGARGGLGLDSTGEATNAS